MNQRTRLLIAQEAARIILNEGVRDFQLAKQKAADRLGCTQRGALPSNTEIESAIAEHREIFFTAEDYRHEIALWRAALAAMRFLEEFSPRLVGSVLQGTAGPHSFVELHVFSDSPEEVLWRLIDSRIAYRSLERRVRYHTDVRALPAVGFVQSGVEIEAILFPLLDLRNAPVSTVDGRPMRRAALEHVASRTAELEASGLAG